ncbi:hypothetical protein IMG5_188040, partial [Ichthyophthirius multifiliis]
LKIVDLNIIPYGNAIRNKENNLIQCQHGENECLANLNEACINKHLAFDKLSNLKLINCLEVNIKTNHRLFDQSFIQKCGDELNIEPQYLQNIQECANSQEGVDQYLKMAELTERLSPSNEYVPWIVVDGVHDEQFEEQVIQNMVQFVCQRYDGDINVEACHQFKQQKYNSFLSLQLKGKK